MPAKDVKAYVKRNKNDAADAEAICEAVGDRPCALADQIGRTAGLVDAASHARCADTRAHPDHQRLAGASGRARVRGAQGNAEVNELRAIVTDEQDTRLPIDARASVIVLAAQLEALESVIGAIEKRIRDAASLERGEPAG